MDETTNTEPAAPTTDQPVIEPVATPTEPTVAPASTGQPEVADVPVIQVDTPAPQAQEVVREVIKEVPVVSSGEGTHSDGTRAQDSLRSFPGPNEWTAPVKEKVVEKIVEKEVIKEVPVEKVVEKIVYQETPITESTFRAKLGDFLRKVGPKGRAMQHERALEKRRAALALFDIHERVTSSLLEESLHLKHSDADRILSDLVKEGKIVLHAPKVEHVTPGKRPHHGGRGSYYTRA